MITIPAQFTPTNTSDAVVNTWIISAVPHYCCAQIVTNGNHVGCFEPMPEKVAPKRNIQRDIARKIERKWWLR